MICKICNSENSEASKFCAACGAKLEAEAPATAAPMFCSGCGSALDANTKFCAVCGTAVGAPAATEAVAPVMAAAPVSAVPTPVNETPAPAGVPTPVNEAPAFSAVPAPVNTAAPTGFGNVVAAQAAAPVDFGAGATDIKPDFGKMSSDGPSQLPAFEASDVAAVAVKPVKKGGKKALKIVLITLGALLIVAGVLYALFFREFFHPMFMGNQGYAAKIERSRTEVVMESEALDNVTKKSNILTDTIVKNMLVSTNVGSSSAELYSALGTEDIGAMIGEYYAAFMELYGVNAVKVDFDADIDLSDAAVSAMDLDDEALELIDYINDAKFTMTYATAQDAVGAFVEATDGDGFTINAKGIVYADGEVALMFPFGSDKCIKAKIDTATGTVVESEEIEVDFDPAEAERLMQGIVDIYLKYYEKSEATIENGDVFIGGTSENPTLKASGRLITVNMSSAALGEMLAEMITYFAEDQYFIDEFMAIGEESGADISVDDIKNEFMAAADEVKYNVPFSLAIKTLVDFNGNVLGGAYNVNIPEQGSMGVKFIMNGDDCGFAVTAMGMEMLSFTVDAKNDTDGQIRLESGALSMGMSMSGSYGMASDMPTGINIDYKGVKNEKFFNTEVPVGTYDIYLAGTAASGPENSMFRLRIEDKVEGNTLKNTFKAEIAEYGSISFNLTSTAYNDTELLTIPSDAYDCGDPNTMTEDQIREAGQYLLDMINEIKAACEGSSSAIAQALSPELDSLAASLESTLTPMADYSDIQALGGEVYNLMFEIMDKYEEGEEYISDDLADEMGDLYGELEAMYDELYYADEMTVEAFAACEDRYEGYRITWNGLVRKADKEIEDGQNAAVAPGVTDVEFVGTWYFYECDMYGFTYTAEELEIEYTLDLRADGSMKMTYLDESTTGTWGVSDGKVIVTEITDYGDYVNEFTIDGDTLVLQDLSVLMRFKK